jgi:hypothetical protein
MKHLLEPKLSTWLQCFILIIATLPSARVARAICETTQTPGCDINCTVQMTMCDMLDDCVARTCSK